MISSVLANGLRSSSPTAVARLASRVREAESAVNDGALASIRAVAQLVPILVALWVLSARLTLAAVLVLAPFAAVLAGARKRWRTWHQESMCAADELHEEVDDLIRHADLWRTYGTGGHIRTVVRSLAHRAGMAQARSETFRTALSSTNEVLAALALVLALGAASIWAWAGTANLIAFAAVFFMAYKPLRDLGDARASLLRGKEALSSLSSVACPPATESRAGAEQSQADGGVLEVDRLCVPGRAPCVSFTLEPGRILAITGPTGAGKTSLLRALLGLESEAAGQVRFGGAPLQVGTVGPDARPFAWVPQDAPVITGTLEDNFALAGVKRSDGEAELSLLGASDLRDGIANVKVGAGGRSLSGGERRWISLARALATREPVLLLDEPTVGLDPVSKERALKTLMALRGHRSVVIVTHDPDVALLADQVIELKHEVQSEAVD
ncbi:MAG: ABC transporter ATP-binding protein [Deltaproteobacteria bacterium]|nr:ABC transporter ATP-binding protein [Deltaproteobacteria bacterium]